MTKDVSFYSLFFCTHENVPLESRCFALSDWDRKSSKSRPKLLLEPLISRRTRKARRRRRHKRDGPRRQLTGAGEKQRANNRRPTLSVRSSIIAGRSLRFHIFNSKWGEKNNTMARNKLVKARVFVCAPSRKFPDSISNQARRHTQQIYMAHSTAAHLLTRRIMTPSAPSRGTYQEFVRRNQSPKERRGRAEETNRQRGGSVSPARRKETTTRGGTA